MCNKKRGSPCPFSRYSITFLLACDGSIEYIYMNIHIYIYELRIENVKRRNDPRTCVCNLSNCKEALGVLCNCSNSNTTARIISLLCNVEDAAIISRIFTCKEILVLGVGCDTPPSILRAKVAYGRFLKGTRDKPGNI